MLTGVHILGLIMIGGIKVVSTGDDLDSFKVEVADHVTESIEEETGVALSKESLVEITEELLNHLSKIKIELVEGRELN